MPQPDTMPIDAWIAACCGQGQAPNGIDEAWLTGRAHALRSDRLKIAFAGRLLADKQPDKAIEAAQELARRLPEREVTIELAGDGPLRPRLQALPAVQGVPAAYRVWLRW